MAQFSGTCGVLMVGDKVLAVKSVSLTVKPIRSSRWKPILAGRPLASWYSDLVAVTPRG